jgi:uncharacterized protein YkwD
VRYLAGGVVVAVLGLTFAFALAPPRAKPAFAAAADDESQLFNLHNIDRGNAGLGALQNDVAAAGVARAWSQKMAASQVLSHNPNLVGDVNANVTTQWTRLGENVGMGPSPVSLDQAFMNSPPHRANILGDYNRMGVGAVRDSRNLLWITVVFVKGPALSVDPKTFLPFSSSSSLVSQQYRDFLGRAGDSGGINFWAGQLNGGVQTPPSVIASFMNSPEFGVIVAPVVRLYQAYFLRIPDYAGLNYWLGQVRIGLPLAQVSEHFAQSAEFIGNYGQLSDADFVVRVYENVLGRPPDKPGQTYWSAQMANGTLTRGGVMINFSESAEYKSRTQSQVNVTMVYVGMLRRSPDKGGYDYWVGQLNAGVSLTALIDGLFHSAEYAARF